MHTYTYQAVVRLWLLVALVLSSLLTVQQRPVAAAGWSGAGSITDGNVHAAFPDIAIDSNGVSHVVWYNTDFSSFSHTYYTNNSGGGWKSPMKVFDGVAYADLPKVTTTTVNGAVHVAIVARAKTGSDIYSNRILFRRSTDGGRNWQSQETATSTTSFEPDVVLDDTGTPHITFMEFANSSYNIYYITRGNSWGGRQLVGSTGDSYRNYATIGYTRVNGTLNIHVMFMGNKGTEASKTVYYSRKSGSSGWTTPAFIQSGANFPELETDPVGGTLYATWQSMSSGNFEAYVGVSTNNGSSWSISNQSQTGALDARPGLGRTPNNQLAVAWDSNYQNTQGDIDARVFDAGKWGGTSRLISAGGISKEVEVGGGPNGFTAVWHDGQFGNFRIFFSTYSLSGGTTPPPPPPSDTSVVPVIEGNAAMTNKTSGINVALTNKLGSPTQVRYAWGAAPTTNSWVNIPSNNIISVAGPANLNTASCASQTLYVQARNSSVTGTTINTDAIVVDAAVQAQVSAMNSLSGAPAFIRTPQASYRVNNEISGCAGVASFQALASNDVSHGTADLNKTITAALSTSGWSVEGKNSDGSNNYVERDVTISVRVNDTLGNTRNFDHVLRLDDDAPVLVSSSGISANNKNGSTAIATISFPNVAVTDETYGGYVTNSQKAFWGVWVLVSHTDLGAPTAQTFAARGAQVIAIPQGTTSTSVYLNGTSSAPGTRYIYLRFLDGAGNPTAGMATMQVQVNADFVNYRTYFPHLVK